MKRTTIFYAIGSVLLLVYVFMAVAMTRAAARDSSYRDLQILVNDSAATGFLNADDVDRLLDDLSSRIATTPRSRINTFHLENRLRANSRIEQAEVLALGNGTLQVSVTPIRPVARVFSGNSSYYINAAGKRIPAEAGFRADVPIVTGVIRSTEDVRHLLPMFAFFRSRPEYDAYVTQVELARNGDILVIPSVAGHVVNLGDTTDIADKMERLKKFYHKVMPTRGWEYYDAISLKWRGRVVATRAAKRADLEVPVVEDFNSDVPDDATISATGIPITDPDAR